MRLTTVGNFRLGVLLFASASLGFGQLDSYTVTITASRSVTPQPDQVVMAVDVTSNLSAGLDDVVASLQGSGITAANLSGVSTQVGYAVSPLQQVLQWMFRLTTPLSQMNATLTSLSNLQNTIGQKNNGMSLTFFPQGLQVSPQLSASQQCSILDLLSDARAQAQKLASAAGFVLGPALTISTGSPAGNPVAAGVVVPQPYFNGVFTTVGTFTAVSLLENFPVAGQSCSLTVKFALNFN